MCLESLMRLQKVTYQMASSVHKCGLKETKRPLRSQLFQTVITCNNLFIAVNRLIRVPVKVYSSSSFQSAHTLTQENGEEYPNEAKRYLHVRKNKPKWLTPIWCVTSLDVSEWQQQCITGNPTGRKRRGVTFNYQMSRECYPPTADVRRSVSVASALAAALPVSNAGFFGFSSVLKGWRHRAPSSSFSQIKASTPKLGWTHIWKPFTL